MQEITNADSKQALWQRIKYIFPFFTVAVIAVIGVFVFRQKVYAWISLCAALLICLPFFIAFQRQNNDAGKLLILMVLTAVSVLGRFAFAFAPHFKPVTAVVIIAGIYLGAQSGFMCGALSALLSNFLFGQGAWTPFQMLIWGLIGFFAGLFSGSFKKVPLLVYIYGIISGAAFSLVMDIWSVLWADGSFKLARYAALIVTALPVTVVYCVSNVIFLAVLLKPLGAKLERVMAKYVKGS